MQGVIAGTLLFGLGIQSISVVVNAGLSLAVTALPTVLERDYDIYLSPWLTLWIAGSVTLHVIGMMALYEQVWWWDHLTHFVSAALVAAVGYAVTVTLDRHTDAVHFPRPFLAVYIFIFTLSAGVVWELLELVGRELAVTFGFGPVLVVYGLEDTMMDLFVDMLGALAVAVGGGGGLARLVAVPRLWSGRDQ